MREIRMRPYLTVGILWSLFLSGMALGDDAASPQPAPTAGLTHHLFRAYAPLFPAFLRVFHGN
jgi:hypothetical protein